MANPCSTIDFIELPPAGPAGGWPWCSLGGIGGDLPSGGKRTRPGGGK